MAGWIAGIALALVVGVNIGQATGRHNAIEEIANECRQAGAFTSKRTAFDCEVRKK
jgi:hypothetical protein